MWTRGYRDEVWSQVTAEKWDLIVIGGGISQAGDRLFVPLRQELARQWPAWSGARVDVAQAALGQDSVLRGAYALVQQLT